MADEVEMLDPEFVKIADIDPDASGANFVAKVVKVTAVETKATLPLFEVKVGDETGMVSFSHRGELPPFIAEGAVVVFRNVVVRMTQIQEKTYLRVTVNQWGKVVLHTPETAFGTSADFTVDESPEKDKTNVEYEMSDE
eukprot:TRINITY_DN2128_c0_g1_i4.p3 TRINITY_DN2128_c0_g1~~TRINITY_DN2128_c0_g1_i4.p3  ORF type:complete len:139 (-),score=37.17 TRINITY_DN2128_c0_g1_i4:256-672(-)